VELGSLIARFLEMHKQPRIGLALAGGSAYGLAHIGVLRFIEEIGLPVHVIAGTSAGAAAGAVWAGGVSSDQMYQVAKQADWLFLAKPVAFKSGLMSSEGIENWINRILGNISFDDLRIKFAATACDFATGELVVIDHGSVAHAVRISCNVPGIYLPVEYQGRLLVDGGLVQNLPASVCQSLGAEYVIGVDLHANLASLRPRTVLKSLIHATHILQRQHERIQLQYVDAVIQPQLGKLNPFNFWPVDEYVDLGYKAALEASGQLCKMLKAILGEQGQMPS
jgi:NTE family protein